MKVLLHNRALEQPGRIASASRSCIDRERGWGRRARKWRVCAIAIAIVLFVIIGPESRIETKSFKVGGQLGGIRVCGLQAGKLGGNGIKLRTRRMDFIHHVVAKSGPEMSVARFMVSFGKVQIFAMFVRAMDDDLNLGGRVSIMLFCVFQSKRIDIGGQRDQDLSAIREEKLGQTASS